MFLAQLHRIKIDKICKGAAKHLIYRSGPKLTACPKFQNPGRQVLKFLDRLGFLAWVNAAGDYNNYVIYCWCCGMVVAVGKGCYEFFTMGVKKNYVCSVKKM